MMITTRSGLRLAADMQGPPDGPALVVAHALGTNRGIWDAVIAALPPHLRVIRYDLRGHGASDTPDGPYSMGQLVSDAEAVCDAAGIRDAVFVGLSVGGMVAQGLAVKRPDLIRALVLSNTAAKIGNPNLWQDRIAAVTAQGLEGVADAVLDRWCSRDTRQGPVADRLRAALVATQLQGYIGTCAAIAGTDFYTPTASLRIPTLGIAGAEDKSTPPDLVRETVDLIPGSRFTLMRRMGHLPCVEDPATYAAHLADFLESIGHG
jgi:3-oxoadipate enol-lactonase